MSNTNSVRRLAFSAIIAAVYAALTMALGFMSYAGIQYRVAEALCVLPFFFPQTTWGLFIGCVIANLLSPAGPLDIVFGSLATLLCCLAIQALPSFPFLQISSIRLFIFFNVFLSSVCQ